MKEVLTELGLKEDSTQADAVEAIKKLRKPDMTAVYEALGLDNGSTPEVVVQAIEGLKSKEIPEAKEYSHLKSQFASIEAENKELKDKIKVGEREAKKAEFAMTASAWKTIPKPTEEIAEELTQLDEANPELAKNLVAHYTALDAQAQKMGIFKAIGTPAEGDAEQKHEFELKMDDLKKANYGMSDADAQAKARQEHPALFTEWMKSRKGE